MALKNWVVTTERLKDKANGLIAYANYLISNTHSNHKGKTTIFPIFGDLNKFVQKTIGGCIAVDQQNTKGGRPMSSYAQSFVLSLPPTLKPTPDEWKKISADVCMAICKHLQVDPKEFKEMIFTNLHQQRSNDHLNVVVSRTFKGGVLLDLDRKSTLAVVKKSFTQAVLKNCQIDVKNYDVRQPKRDQRFRSRVPTWQHKLKEFKRLELVEDTIKKAKKEFAELIASADAWVKACRERDEEAILEHGANFVSTYDALQALNKEPLNKRILEVRSAAEEITKQKF
jgi:hypothetical protein